MSNQNGAFSLVDYDVHQVPGKDVQATYSVIYRHLGRISIPFTASVYMVKRAFGPAMELAFAKINAEVAERGLSPVTFHVTPVEGSADEVMERRAGRSLEKIVASIGAGLAVSISKIDAALESAAADVNACLRKASLALSRARRELDDARALAVGFGLTESVADAVKATAAVIEAETAKRELRKTARKELEAKAAALGLEVVDPGTLAE